MSKYNTIEVWNKLIGKDTEVYDYAGRLIKKSACSNPHSRFFPTIDHIRPLSQGGSDILENLVICHRDTNEEKGDSFPHWQANGVKYKAIRVRGTRNEYDIYEEE
ncbi:MAG: HNH endonuclease [Roseburia sp.]|nr:HNH endonuclease [Roseburia sp.]MCM1557810.1 HNH endonuclease [Anaeroplasma bactoclasticum]